MEGGRRKNYRGIKRDRETWGKSDGVTREEAGEQESTLTLPCLSDVCYDPCTFVSVCSCWFV